MDTAEAGLNDPACTLPESRRQKLLADVDVMRGFYLYWNRDLDGALKHLLCNANPVDCQAGLAYAHSAVEQLRQRHNTRQLIQFMAVKAIFHFW